MNRSLIFTNRHLKYTVGINKYQDQVTTNFQYKRYLFDFDAAYRDRNLCFVFDSDFYIKWKPGNKTVIVNKSIWDRASGKERNKIGLM